ncbi:hypothetical protein J6590_002759 [Homalodisca vitripennis]|nr:hypothetical protein J6590_002759 [Homalodisca vitripennis]
MGAAVGAFHDLPSASPPPPATTPRKDCLLINARIQTSPTLDSARVALYSLPCRTSDLRFELNRPVMPLHCIAQRANHCTLSVDLETSLQVLQNEYDDPLSTYSQMKPLSRTVGPGPGLWTHCPPLRKY